MPKTYDFQLSDLRPFAGWIDYNHRCGWEALSQAKPNGEDTIEFLKKYSARKIVLGAYNIVAGLVGLGVLAGASAGIFFGLKGLVEMISR